MDDLDDLLRAADAADAKRFPTIHYSELELWCSVPAWTVAETVALSIMRDPGVISPEVIKNLDLILHPHGVAPKDWKRLSRIAGLYEARHIHLLRAARHDSELHATPVEGGFEIRPLDFLAWEKLRRGQGPWSGLPDALVERVRAFHGGNADTGKEKTGPSVSEPAPPAQPDTGKEKGLSSSGVSSSEQACLACLIGEMLKYPDHAPKSKTKYWEDWKKIVTWRGFQSAWSSAINATRSTWDRPGKRKKPR